MKKTLYALLASAILTILGSGNAFAQGAPPWVIVPVDLWVCNFNDRQDMDDLDNWMARFNAWADENANDTYANWTLTPAYWGPNQEMDFISLGVWTDANEMGQGWDEWNRTNGGLMDDFAEIASCSVHGNFASAAYRLPEGLDNTDTGILTVSDCTLHEDANQAAVDRAARLWADAIDETGSRAAIYHWYPVFGGGGQQFDFKWVEAYENYTELGADYERMGNGMMFGRYQQLFDHLMSCDAARVYNVKNRRFVNVRAGQ